MKKPIETMRVTVAKSELVPVLERCQAVADKKNTMPVLAHVLLEAADGKMVLRATDLYLAISGIVAAEVSQPGSVCVAARDLLERVKFMPEGQITITCSDVYAMTLTASGAARRYTLPGLAGDDFPTLPTAPDDQSATLDVDQLLRLITATQFAISPDETRLHLNSALFERDGRVIRMVATDGHRLSLCEERTEESGTSTLLIPLRGVQEIRRLLSGADAKTVELSTAGPCVFLKIDQFELSVKLVDAQFPPWRQVCPESTTRTVKAQRELLASTLKAVSVAASDRTGGVKLTLTNGKLRVEAESPDSGQGQDEIAVDYEGDELIIGVNARYVLDVCGALICDELVIGMSEELDPIKIETDGKADGSKYTAVVMPMRK